MVELIPIIMFAVICLVLLAGFPVAFSLAGTALIFSGIGILTGTFEPALLGTIPNRLYGDMTNMTLVAIPLFVFMGVLLEKSNLAQDLLSNILYKKTYVIIFLLTMIKNIKNWKMNSVI